MFGHGAFDPFFAHNIGNPARRAIRILRSKLLPVLSTIFTADMPSEPIRELCNRTISIATRIDAPICAGDSVCERCRKHAEQGRLMRTARHQNTMDRFNSSGGESVTTKELSAGSVTSVAEAPAWTTRAKPKGIARVPTHAVRPVEERRTYSRAKLSLSIRVKRIAGQRRQKPRPLRTTNISSSGVLFLCPHHIAPGTPVELEVCLVDRPLGRGSVKMTTEAHVVRAEPSQRSGWHTLAACFDEITFQREEVIPSRFLKH